MLGFKGGARLRTVCHAPAKISSLILPSPPTCFAHETVPHLIGGPQRLHRSLQTLFGLLCLESVASGHARDDRAERRPEARKNLPRGLRVSSLDISNFHARAFPTFSDLCDGNRRLQPRSLECFHASGKKHTSRMHRKVPTMALNVRAPVQAWRLSNGAGRGWEGVGGGREHHRLEHAKLQKQKTRGIWGPLCRALLRRNSVSLLLDFGHICFCSCCGSGLCFNSGTQTLDDSRSS